MSLVEHARRELELCGQAAESPEYADSLVRAVEAFASYGHSGGSAAVGTAQLMDLLRFRPLSPLTSDPSEWHKHDPAMTGGEDLWQNLRDPAAMSKDGGATWYYVDGRPEPGPRLWDSEPNTVTHIAGDIITLHERYMRQRCSWCGKVLIEYDLTRVAVPEGQPGPPGAWPPGAMVRVDGIMSAIIEDPAVVDDMVQLPMDSCTFDPKTQVGFDGR